MINCTIQSTMNNAYLYICNYMDIHYISDINMVYFKQIHINMYTTWIFHQYSGRSLFVFWMETGKRIRNLNRIKNSNCFLGIWNWKCSILLNCCSLMCAGSNSNISMVVAIATTKVVACINYYSCSSVCSLGGNSVIQQIKLNTKWKERKCF